MKAVCFVLLCCLLVAAASMPAAAYFVEGENVLTSPDWSEPPNSSGDVSAVERTVISDPDASGGEALNVIDGLVPDADYTTDMSKFFYRSLSAEPFNGSATAVARIKTGQEIFEGPANRTLILSFTSKPGTTARRAVGLNIYPDQTTITNTTGSQVYATIPGDNTSFVTWTIVARDYGYWYDIYREGALVYSNTVANPSSSEGVIGAVDALTIGSSPSSATGSWIYDWLAYKPGEDPTWNPVPEPSSLLALCTGLAGMAGVLLRSRRS